MVKFGIQHPSFSWDGTGGEIPDTLVARARFAEEHGIDSIWVMDHLFQISSVGRPEEPMLESWSTVSFLAGATPKIRVGSLVTGNMYRNPALLAKVSASVDVLSNGRLFMGLGAGWFEQEAAAYGIPHYTVPERLKRLDEAVQILLGMWTEERFSFDGRYYKVKDAFCNPKPVQKPHPPLMIGGSGEKVTLKIVAKYGDACNLWGGPKSVGRRLEILKEHCKNVGRNYDQILKTTLSTMIIAEGESQVRSSVEAKMGPGVTEEKAKERAIYGTPDQVKKKIREFLDLGVEYMIFSFQADKEEKMLKLFAEEVLPGFNS
jgi:F420-dependent oxidoreductase-like protein